MIPSSRLSAIWLCMHRNTAKTFRNHDELVVSFERLRPLVRCPVRFAMSTDAAGFVDALDGEFGAALGLNPEYARCATCERQQPGLYRFVGNLTAGLLALIRSCTVA